MSSRPGTRAQRTFGGVSESAASFGPTHRDLCSFQGSVLRCWGRRFSSARAPAPLGMKALSLNHDFVAPNLSDGLMNRLASEESGHDVPPLSKTFVSRWALSFGLRSIAEGSRICSAPIPAELESLASSASTTGLADYLLAESPSWQRASRAKLNDGFLFLDPSVCIR